MPFSCLVKIRLCSYLKPSGRLLPQKVYTLGPFISRVTPSAKLLDDTRLGPLDDGVLVLLTASAAACKTKYWSVLRAQCYLHLCTGCVAAGNMALAYKRSPRFYVLDVSFLSRQNFVSWTTLSLNSPSLFCRSPAYCSSPSTMNRISSSHCLTLGEKHREKGANCSPILRFSWTVGCPLVFPDCDLALVHHARVHALG